MKYETQSKKTLNATEGEVKINIYMHSHLISKLPYFWNPNSLVGPDLGILNAVDW